MDAGLFNALFYIVVIGLPVFIVVRKHKHAIAGIEAKDLPASGFSMAMGIVALIVGCAALFGGMLPIIGLFGAMFGIVGALIAIVGLFSGIGTRSIGIPAAGLVVCMIPILWQMIFLGVATDQFATTSTWKNYKNSCVSEGGSDAACSCLSDYVHARFSDEEVMQIINKDRSDLDFESKANAVLLAGKLSCN